jgi:hypothetical protein
VPCGGIADHLQQTLGAHAVAEEKKPGAIALTALMS